MFVLICVVLAVFCGVISGVPIESSVSTNLDPRIHGGVDAPPGYAPHMVALLTGDRVVSVVCGGSIITSKHVLTAAHCITPFVRNDQLSPTFHGRVGSNIWHTGGEVVQFKTHSIHPKWDVNIIKFDVGILCLTQRLMLSDKINIIGLEFRFVDGNEDSYVTGWGTTWPRFEENWVSLAPTPDNLQLLYLSTLSGEQCKKGIKYHESGYIAPPLDPELEICTFHSVGFGMCHGDSGSALVSMHSKLQIGIVSWGLPCARGAPDFYTRVSAVSDYIMEVISTC